MVPGTNRAAWDTTGAGRAAWAGGAAWAGRVAWAGLAAGASCSTRGGRECEAWTAVVVPWTSPRVVTAVVPMVEPRGGGAISQESHSFS